MVVNIETVDMTTLSRRAIALANSEELKDLIETMYWKYVKDTKKED